MKQEYQTITNSSTHFLKSTYAKGKPKFVYYRCFKNFNKELLKKNISENLKNIGNSLEVFYDTSIITDF